MDSVARTHARCLDPALGTWPVAGELRFKKEHAMKNSTLLCAVLGATLATSLPGSARTVFDAGKALRQNCAGGAPVGADGEIYADGTTDEIFSDPDRLYTAGMDVPEVMKIALELKKRGYPLDGKLYTVEGVRDAVLRAVGRGGIQ